MTELRIAISTVPTLEEAERLAQLAVEGRLAACVQILPNLPSIYRWHGKVEKSTELLLLFKTSTDKIDPLRDAILAAHSYQTPEFIVLSVESASAGYMQWLLDSV